MRPPYKMDVGMEEGVKFCMHACCDRFQSLVREKVCPRSPFPGLAVACDPGRIPWETHIESTLAAIKRYPKKTSLPGCECSTVLDWCHGGSEAMRSVHFVV
eukprot:TRINITY_DN54063_c0_g1_i1.p2 TRINITY_DN54063_c0_g1~~TRINITY_DN54063_c0_g1_i1.p2  ORF type:complete len:101 (+),score=8.11 TRINITY_DN54063_c0_g1_i1:138-440(+)